MAPGSLSYETRMLANWVSPPSGGTSRAERSEASAGTRLNELSLCHIWLPALKRLRVSPCGIRRSSASTFARLEISGGLRTCETIVRIVVSSGPKRRLKAICSSSLIGCRRKRSTECSSKACAMSAKVASSTRLTSMPRISTPNSGWSGFVPIAMLASPPGGGRDADDRDRPSRPQWAAPRRSGEEEVGDGGPRSGCGHRRRRMRAALAAAD